MANISWLNLSTCCSFCSAFHALFSCRCPNDLPAVCHHFLWEDAIAHAPSFYVPSSFLSFLRSYFVQDLQGGGERRACVSWVQDGEFWGWMVSFHLPPCTFQGALQPRLMNPRVLLTGNWPKSELWNFMHLNQEEAWCMTAELTHCCGAAEEPDSRKGAGRQTN